MASYHGSGIALHALIYLYKRYMEVDVGELKFALARGQRRLPLVYSREEITAILAQTKKGSIGMPFKYAQPQAHQATSAPPGLGEGNAAQSR